MTAVLVAAREQSEEAWLAARRLGVSASEIAAVMSISPYESPFSLFWRKRMGWDADVNDEMRLGTFLEPTIVSWFEEFGDPNENLHIERAGLYAHAERGWQLATPDRLIQVIDDCGGECEDGLVANPDSTFFIEGYEPCRVCGRWKTVGLLECKYVAYSWDGWGDEGTDDVPVHIRAQCLWQLDVMGVDEVLVCALGPGGFRVYRVRRDEKDLRGMREAGLRFMDLLTAGTAPDVDDHSATLPILRRLHPEIEDREQEIPAAVAEGWQRSRRFAALAEKCKARYTAQLRLHLGSAKTATLGGRAIAARTSNDQLRSKA